MRCEVARRARAAGGWSRWSRWSAALRRSDAARAGRTPRRRRTPRAWPAPNGDAANHRRASSSIDAASVDDLGVAWRVPLAAGYAATPIVLDGVVYAQDLQSNVYAIDLADGHLRWRHDYEESDIGPNGVNVVGGQVFGATQTRAFALDAETGRQLWSTPVAQNESDAIDMAPGVADGTVYVSTAVKGAGAVGTLWALDAATGRTKWRWRQVPADLWGRPDVKLRRRPVASAGVRRRRPALRQHRQPAAVPRRGRAAVGSEPAGREQMDELDRQARPGDRQGAVGEAGAPARPLRLGPRGAGDPRPRRRAAARGDGWEDGDRLRLRRGRRQAALEAPASGATTGTTTTTCSRCGAGTGRGRPQTGSCRAGGAASRRRWRSDGHAVFGTPSTSLATVYDADRLTPSDPDEGTGRMVAIDLASGRVR